MFIRARKGKVNKRKTAYVHLFLLTFRIPLAIYTKLRAVVFFSFRDRRNGRWFVRSRAMHKMLKTVSGQLKSVTTSDVFNCSLNKAKTEGNKGHGRYFDLFVTCLQLQRVRFSGP